MKSEWLALVFCSAFAAVQACPQTPSVDERQETKRLLQVAGVARQFDVMCEILASKQAPETAKRILTELAQRRITEVDRRALDALTVAVREEFRRSFTTEVILNALAPIYERYFTLEETREILRFYESPVGAKLASTTPAILAEAAEFGSRLSQEAFERLDTQEFRLKAMSIIGKYDKPKPDPTRSESPVRTAPAAGNSQPGEVITIVPKLRVSGAEAQRQILLRVFPEYPPLAKQARVQGTVRLNVTIGMDGRVKDVQLISGHPLLVPAAVEAVKQWQFSTTSFLGMEVIAQMDVNFALAR